MLRDIIIPLGIVALLTPVVCVAVRVISDVIYSIRHARFRR